MNCNFCNKEYSKKLSLSNHKRHCKMNPNKITLTYKSKGNQWSNENYKMADKTKQKISASQKGRIRSQEVKDRLSEIAYQRNLGGHTSKKKVYFKKNNGEVVYLQSSYESIFASILEQNNIDWNRPDPLIWIDEFNKKHRYYPDFMINKTYYDTKNDYLIKKDAEKIKMVEKQNNVKIHVVSKDNINLVHILKCLYS